MNDEDLEVRNGREDKTDKRLPSSSVVNENLKVQPGGVQSDSARPSFNFWRYFFKIVLVLAILAVLVVVTLFVICLNSNISFGP